METEHSPLPYKLGKKSLNYKMPVTEIRDANGENVADVYDGFAGSEGGPAFIVRACNNHYKLIEALRLATEQLERAVSGRRIDTKVVNVVLEGKALAEAEAK